MSVLLSSVFGPYGVDDAYGRKENVMELFHNQVTREQGIFSFRFHHQSFGLYMIAENIAAPAVVLDFPAEEAFVRELGRGYDFVGISFIVPNFLKAKRMAELVRLHAPASKIVLGGHGTQIPGVEHLIEHDHICRGEGVKWFRRLLGEEPDRPLRHPVMSAGFDQRLFGFRVGDNAGSLFPGVGCPNACRFCATSHFFGKRYTPFFDTGQELFDACVENERRLGSRDFFVMDENFLKRPQRARELLDLIEKNGKDYGFGIFTSAETIASLGVELMARLGVYFVWVGVEAQRDMFEKNRGIDLGKVIRDLRDHGIIVLASGILFLEHHDRESIWDDIRYLVGMEPDFVQFMQLGPMPGTALYRDYDERGLLRKDVPYEEWHGQHRLWFRHPDFTPEESEQLLRDAFRYDFDTLGPSLLRICNTLLRGYETLGRYRDPLMAKRRERLRRQATSYRPALAVLRHYAHNDHVRDLVRDLEARYGRVLGPTTTGQRLLGLVARGYAAREAARVASGRTMYQPKTIRTQYRYA
ncbi:MAG: radical SAM protein [Deltaproteobacteria bacterium]|nr:radical SAM protein [Deltaproteobacteria bacterium]